MNNLTVNAAPGQTAVDGASMGTAAAPADANLFALLLGGYAASAMPPATPAPAIGDSGNPASASLSLLDGSIPVTSPPAPEAVTAEDEAAVVSPNAEWIAAMLGQLQAPQVIITRADAAFAPPAQAAARGEAQASPIAAAHAAPVALTNAAPLAAASNTEQAPPVPQPAAPPAVAAGVETALPPTADTASGRATFATPAAVPTPVAEPLKTAAMPVQAHATLPDAALSHALRQLRLAPAADAAPAAPAAMQSNELPETPRNQTAAAVQAPFNGAARDNAAATERPVPSARFDHTLQATASSYSGEPATNAAPAVAAPATRADAFGEHFERVQDIATTALGTPPGTPFTTALHRETLPAVAIAPPLNTPEWQPAFANGVRMLVSEGQQVASLQLNPGEFGPIEVRIVMNDQRADISFVVANPEANTAVLSALSELRDQLARSGIQLGQTSVGAHPQEHRQPAPAPQHAATGGSPVGSTSANPESPPAPRPARGQIDTFA